MEPPGGLPTPSPSTAASRPKRTPLTPGSPPQLEGESLDLSFATSEGCVKQVPITRYFTKLGISVHICNLCKPPKTFATAEHLSHHEASHEQPRFPCHGCDRIFQQEELLLRHLEKNEHDHEQGHPTLVEPDKTKQLPTPASSVAPLANLVLQNKLSRGKSSRLSQGEPTEGSLTLERHKAKDGVFSGLYRGTAPKTTNKDRDRPSQPSKQKTKSNREPVALIRPPSKPPRRDRGVFLPDGDINKSGSGSGTDYSDEDSIEDFDVEVFKSRFAETIASRVRQHDIEVEKENWDRMFDTLPSLVAAFALKLGQKGATQTQMNAMYLAHKYRRDISTRVQVSISASLEKGSTAPSGQQGSTVEPTSSRIRDWLDTDVVEGADAEPSPEDTSRPPEQPDSTNKDDVGILPDSSKYETVFSSTAFKWLLSSVLQTVCRSATGPLDAINTIGSQIRYRYRNRQKAKMSRHRHSNSHKMYLLADLDLVAFLNEQFGQSPMSRRELLTTAITVTGLEADAQALPCAKYVQQTWPITGLYVLDAICSAVDSQATCTETLPDGSDVTANLIQDPTTQRFGIRIKANGTADFLGEVGEIFGWITAALRASPSKSELAWCEPYLYLSGKGSEPMSNLWEMRFTTTHPKRGLSDDEVGKCWHGLFQNVAIVKGFPISHRSCRNTGLEIPLNMAARLMDSSKLHEFMGRYYIKGFSAMLTAVGLTDGVVLWHLDCNSSGRRISYCDAVKGGGKGKVGLSLTQVHSGRHVVGWCSKALCMAGDKDANYDVRKSGLPFPGREFSLEKISLSVGNIITGGVQFSIGKKDVPLHITKQGYVAKLRWIDQKYVIFWDEEDQRGWLVRGSSALLHLVRASLEHCRSDDFSSEFLFNFEAFKEAPEHVRFTPNSALKVLLDKDNRGLSLYREERTQEKTITSDGRWTRQIETTATFTTLEDKIVETYETLEKIIDGQARSAASAKGLNAKLRGSGRIEGWDFKDIAAARDPFYLRVASLPEYGQTWIPFARSIQAVTLFGRGFGDIIKPNLDTNNPAVVQPTRSAWDSMPVGHGLLGACLGDLKEIIDNHGNLVILDRLFKSEALNPDIAPQGGIIFGPHTKLKRVVRAAIPGPSQLATKDSQASASTASYSDDVGSTPPSLVPNRRLHGGLLEVPESDPISQDTLPTTPGPCRTPSVADLENVAPSVVDDDAPPGEDEHGEADHDGDPAVPATLGLLSSKRRQKRSRSEDGSENDDEGNKIGKRRKLWGRLVMGRRPAGDGAT